MAPKRRCPTECDKTVDKKKQIRNIAVEIGAKTANNAIKYNSIKEKGVLSQMKKLKDKYKKGDFNSLPPDKRKEFIKADYNLAQMKQEKTWYGKTKKIKWVYVSDLAH